MAGINRFTFKVEPDGWEHTKQSLFLLFVTRIGSRFMRRLVGAGIPALLGRSMTPPTILRFKTAIIVACELWEPRFIVDIVPTLDDANTPEKMRGGELALAIVGEYVPGGLKGDTGDGQRKVVYLAKSQAGTLETA